MMFMLFNSLVMEMIETGVEEKVNLKVSTEGHLKKG